MKDALNDVTHCVETHRLSIVQCYHLIAELPNRTDLLEDYGVTMTEFEGFVDKYQSDTRVRELIAIIMGSPPSPLATPKQRTQLSVREIIDVHAYMLDAVMVAVDVLARSEIVSDAKLATITLRVIAQGEVLRKFGIGKDDLEHSVLKHSAELRENSEYTSIYTRMQQAVYPEPKGQESMEEKDANKKHQDPASLRRRLIKSSIACVTIATLSTFLLAYAVMKLIAAYNCDDGVWNVSGCVQINPLHGTSSL